MPETSRLKWLQNKMKPNKKRRGMRCDEANEQWSQTVMEILHSIISIG